jgi:hypothetical protein
MLPPLPSDTPETGPNERLNTPWSSVTLSSRPMASTVTSTPSSKSSGSSNVGAVVGGVIGGVIAISAAAFFIFLRRRRKHRQGLPTAAVFDPTPQPFMDEFRPQASDGGAFVSPSLPETRASPMRHYVRVYTSLSQTSACSHVPFLFYMRRTRTSQPRSPGTKDLTLCQGSAPRYPQHPTLETPPTTCSLHHHRHTVVFPLFDMVTLLVEIIVGSGHGWITSFVFGLCLSGRGCRQ